MVLIGIGNAGSDLVKEFNKTHTKIQIRKKDFPSVCRTAEDYESKCPDFTNKLSFDEEECWVCLSGTSNIASSTLRILETIKHKVINIIYIYPDLSLCNAMQLRKHKVVYNVLQEYTRSGLLHRMYLFSNANVLEVIGNQPINKLYSNINKQISNAIETLSWLKTQTPVMGSEHEAKLVSRICTLSVGNLKKNEEKLLFPIDNITEASYHYSVSNNQLEKNKDMLSLVKKKIESDEKQNIVSSFQIFSSEHNQSFFYSVKFTHFIQTNE